MAITLKQYEKGIYVAEWTGVVTIDAVVHENNRVREFAKQNDDLHYVLIIDMTRVMRVPVDIYSIRKIAEAHLDRSVTFILVRPTPIARVLSRMVQHVTKQSFLVCKGMEEAVSLARENLARYSDCDDNPDNNLTSS